MPRQKPNGIETRLARINVAFTPTLKRDLVDLAFAKQKSVNALIEGALLDYVKHHEAFLKEYRAFTKKFSR